MRFPDVSPATHVSAFGHARAVIVLPASSGKLVQTAAPPVGLSVITTSPRLSSPTHSEADGQSRRTSWIPIAATFQEADVDLGRILVRTFPRPSNAAQK